MRYIILLIITLAGNLFRFFVLAPVFLSALEAAVGYMPRYCLMYLMIQIRHLGQENHFTVSVYVQGSKKRKAASIKIFKAALEI